MVNNSQSWEDQQRTKAKSLEVWPNLACARSMKKSSWRVVCPDSKAWDGSGRKGTGHRTLWGAQDYNLRHHIMRKSTMQWEFQVLLSSVFTCSSCILIQLMETTGQAHSRILRCLGEAVKPQWSCPGYISSAILFLLSNIFAFLPTVFICKGLKGHVLPTYSLEVLL